MLLTEYSNLQKYFAEFAATFFLIFMGTGSVIVHQITGGTVTLVGIALVWGSMVTTMVYAFGHVSGAHMNPAVTFGLFLAGRFETRNMLPYVIFQVAGAIAASAALHLLFPTSTNLGMTLPAANVWQSFALEIFLSLMLMLVILQVSTSSKEVGMFAGLAIGMVIILEVLVGGPISGASMNPARSLGPAIVAGQLQHLWIYLTAPLLGMAVGVGMWRLLLPKAKED
jgi:aquaporin NIP